MGGKLQIILLSFHWCLSPENPAQFSWESQNAGSVQPRAGCGAFNFWSRAQQTVKHFCGVGRVELRCLINEQTGRQPLFLVLYGFNEACLKNAACCSSY